MRRGARREARERMEQNAAFHAVLEEFRVLNETEPVEKKEPAERSLLVKEKKRFWRKKYVQQKGGDKKFSLVCLVDAIRSLGVKVPYQKHGPMWALSDGNVLLEPFQCLVCKNINVHQDVVMLQGSD